MKKYLMGLVAIGLAVAFSAFSTGKLHKQNETQTTYKYYSVSYASPYQTSGAILQSDRKSTRLNSSHLPTSRMPSSA